MEQQTGENRENLSIRARVIHDRYTAARRISEEIGGVAFAERSMPIALDDNGIFDKTWLSELEIIEPGARERIRVEEDRIRHQRIEARNQILDEQSTRRRHKMAEMMHNGPKRTLREILSDISISQ